MHGPDTFDCAGLVWFLYYKLFKIDIYDNGYGLSTTTKIMTSSYGKITLFDEDSFSKDLSLIKKEIYYFFIDNLRMIQHLK